MDFWIPLTLRKWYLIGEIAQIEGILDPTSKKGFYYGIRELVLPAFFVLGGIGFYLFFQDSFASILIARLLVIGFSGLGIVAGVYVWVIFQSWRLELSMLRANPEDGATYNTVQIMAFALLERRRSELDAYL